MPLVLATIASLVFGVADFSGAMATRKAPAVTVVVGANISGLVALIAVAPLFGEGVSPLSDLGWGALGGVAGSIGIALLYHALATTRMGITAPATALVGAATPVAFGIAIGERPMPMAWVGMALALPAMLLLSRRHHENEVAPVRAVLYGVAVGVCFGVFGILLSRTGPASGVWPLVAARVASAVLMSAVAFGSRRPLVAPAAVWPLMVVAGLLDSGANVLFLLAVRVELLSLVAVIMSLYPASTVGLARVVLGERFSRHQALGMALAVLAVTLIALA